MSEKISLKLDTLPVELIYRILDHLDALSILRSLQNVNQRMNTIITSYRPFQVNFSFHSKSHIYYLFILYNVCYLAIFCS